MASGICLLASPALTLGRGQGWPAPKAPAPKQSQSHTLKHRPHHVSVCLVALQRPSGFAKTEVRLSWRAPRLTKIPPAPRREGRCHCEAMAPSQPRSRGAAQGMVVCARHVQGLMDPVQVRPHPRGQGRAKVPGELLMANLFFLIPPGQGQWQLQDTSPHKMAHAQGRDPHSAGRELLLAHCLGLPPRCLRKEQEVAPFPAQQAAASSYFPLC